jgi:WD40 repeat protein
MQWSPNGKLLATGSKDCTVIVWNFDPVALKLSHYKVPVLPYRPYGTFLIS